jgi:murein DD-endopeptidase MepM/ murein hydrolase activator NlpD
VDQGEIDQLRTENQDLRNINRSFEESIRSLEVQLANYEDRTRQLAIVAGLESLAEGGEAGVGGEHLIPEAGAGLYDLTEMESRAGELAGRLDLVEHQLEEQLRLISSTPAISPVRGLLTSGFGYRSDPFKKERAFHPGVDISAPPGHPVKATADGLVVRAGRNGGLGRSVYVSHGYGITTRYGHLSKIDVKPGDVIKRGDKLGEVGNTGRSTGYHLHYEVRVEGKAVNPLGYILDRDG